MAIAFEFDLLLCYLLYESRLDLYAVCMFSVRSSEPVWEWRFEQCNMQVWLSGILLGTQMWKYEFYLLYVQSTCYIISA